MKINFIDKVKALILLPSLPGQKERETLVIAISNYGGKEALKLDDVRDLVLSESTPHKDSRKSSGEACNAQDRGTR